MQTRLDAQEAANLSLVVLEAERLGVPVLARLLAQIAQETDDFEICLAAIREVSPALAAKAAQSVETARLVLATYQDPVALRSRYAARHAGGHR